MAKYGKEVAKPENPVKTGYTFAGWYEDEALTKKYEIPDTMPNEDRIVYAKWEASDMTYSVADYVEGTDGVYSLASIRTETAKTDDTVTVQPSERSGFITPPVLSYVVQADGSTRFNYYYARNKYNVKFVSEGETVSEGSYTYGTQMPTPSVYRPGYEFAGGKVMEENIIRIENAALKLGKFSIKPAIINIPKGYIVGIQGDNGAGKSTMLRMLLGMYDKMQGNIYIDGIDVVKNRTQIKNITGVVSQERTFFMEEDAYENERLYAPFYKNWNSDEYRKMLKNLNINSGRSLGNLSTGEMLKYQLAFAAAYRPQVLLLDEPTANLDPVFRDDFLKILQEFIAEYDMTILMATHLDEDISKIADYIMDVEDGRYSLRECI